MARKLEHIDPRALDVTWAPGTVHLHIDGQLVLSMSPEVAARLSQMTRVCLVAALEADPTATAEGWTRELLTKPWPTMTEAEFQHLPGPATRRVEPTG